MKYFAYTIMIAISLVACNRGSGTPEATEEKHEIKKDTLKISSMPAYMDSIKSFKTRRDITKSNLAELEKKYVPEMQKIDYEKTINDLETKLDLLNQKLNTLEESSPARWNMLKKDIDSTFRNIDHVIDSTKNTVK